uniref:DBIRD complex subunit ZNF326-like n=1 Tax=Myxine glutinosa TaxID=7769 RepID=UPI00358EF6AE
MNFKVPSLMKSSSGPAGGPTFPQTLGGSCGSRPARGEDSGLLFELSALARSSQLLEPQKSSSGRKVFFVENKDSGILRQSDGRANRYDDGLRDYHRHSSESLDGYGGPKSFSARESSPPVRYQSRQESNAYGRKRSGIPVGYKGGWRDPSPDSCGGDPCRDSRQGGRDGFRDSWNDESSRRGSYYGNGRHGRDRSPNFKESTMDTATELLRDVVDLLRLEKVESRDDDHLGPQRRSGLRHSYGSGSSSRYDPSRSSPPRGSRGRRDSPRIPHGSSFGQYNPSGGHRAGGYSGGNLRMEGRNWDEGPLPKRLRPNSRFELRHSRRPKEQWLHFKYKYSCFLCKVSTFNNDWMDEHMNCKSHKEMLQSIDNMFPKDLFISEFLHHRVLQRNQEIVPKMQKEWEDIHKKPFMSQITDFKLPEGWLRQQVVRCLACRVFTSLDKKHILDHVKSSIIAGYMRLVMLCKDKVCALMKKNESAFFCDI